MRITITLIVLVGCNRHDPPKPTPAPPPAAAPAPAFYDLTSAKHPAPAALAAFGRTLFGDPSLSAGGALACATCHDPERAYGPGRDVGARPVPSLRYLQSVPRFSEHLAAGEDGGTDGPGGGFMWDGRAATAHEQARLPLFAPDEMANVSEATLAATLRKAYDRELRALFGDAAFASDRATVDAATLAIEVFEQTPADFAPFTSKYDGYLRGTAQLSPAEARGLALFESPAKGNCASCHPSRTGGTGFPVFSDFGYNALGLPRAKGALPGSIDLGLCGPKRTDLAGHAAYCGMFRTPSLRNVALRKRLFHNGAITSLPEAVRFYATRDTGRWGPPDLPERYRGNLEPFTAKLTEPEIADIVAFLGTLTDE